MTRRRIFMVFACLIASLVVLQPLSAQVFGSITGYVTDDSGAALPGVGVEGVNTDTGARRSGMTNAAGFYNLEALVAGFYDITASIDGFQSVRRERVQVLLGQDIGINLSMAVGSVEEAITVTAETPAIEISQIGDAHGASHDVEMELDVGQPRILDDAQKIRAERAALEAGQPLLSPHARHGDVRLCV